MLALPNDIPERDISQWMGGGAVALLDRTTPVSLMGFVPGEIHLSNVLTGDREVVAWSERGSRLFMHWPTCNSVNLDKFAIYIERKQQQQYRRTYNSRVLSLAIPFKWNIMRALGPEAIRVDLASPEVIAAVFRPEYLEWDDAINQMREGSRVSVAVSPHVILGKLADALTVFYRGRRAGIITSDNKFEGNGYDLAEPRIFKLLQGRITL